jgi:hypothetical protein
MGMVPVKSKMSSIDECNVHDVINDCRICDVHDGLDDPDVHDVLEVWMPVVSMADLMTVMPLISIS